MHHGPQSYNKQHVCLLFLFFNDKIYRYRSYLCIKSTTKNAHVAILSSSQGGILYNRGYCSKEKKMARFSFKLYHTYGICLFIIILFVIYKYNQQNEFRLVDKSRRQTFIVSQENTISASSKIIEPLQQMEEKKFKNNKR